jgi:hypothetical protein
LTQKRDVDLDKFISDVNSEKSSLVGAGSEKLGIEIP